MLTLPTRLSRINKRRGAVKRATRKIIDDASERRINPIICALSVIRRYFCLNREISRITYGNPFTLPQLRVTLVDIIYLKEKRKKRRVAAR